MVHFRETGTLSTTERTVLGQSEMGNSWIADAARIPVEAGIRTRGTRDSWTPAFAGVTGLTPCARRSDLILTHYYTDTH